MTTLFLLVKGVCQSLNELGVVSVTKSGPAKTGPAGPLATALREHNQGQHSYLSSGVART